MRLLSPRELALALGVSESSLKRWVDSGKIAASRTDGGHRKIALPEAVRFIRETGAPLAHPEVLDLPEGTAAESGGAQVSERLLGYLERGDEPSARGWLVARYLGGASIAELADGPIRAAMHTLGELWRHDPRGIFIEHRATEVCMQALGYLRDSLEDPPHAAIALGGSPEHDPYRVPTLLAAMVATEAGMRAINLGPDTPLAALDHAIAEHRPRLVWVSATTKLAPGRAQGIATWIAGLPPTITAIVGGRAGAAIAEARPGVRYVDSMVELAMIARKLTAPPGPRS